MENKPWKDNNLLNLKEEVIYKESKSLSDNIPWGKFTINKFGDTVLPDYLDGESYEL